MRICQVQIRDFRGIREATLTLPQHAVLLGANNAGKSTIIEALALLLGRERMIRPVGDWDFYGGVPKPESRFYIIATITDFPTNDPSELPNWFLGDAAGHPTWWSEDAGTLSEDADPPDGSKLSVRLALCGRYDEETCEFETIRFFYHGDTDPFTEPYAPLPSRLLRELGLFLLSANRDWDRILSFGSSSLLKAMRQSKAVPNDAVNALKTQFRSGVAKPEAEQPFKGILEAAAGELAAFGLIEPGSSLAYRPTSLDTLAVMQSLVPHITDAEGTYLPVSRHGAGLITLQAFLLLLTFSDHRLSSGGNFILAAEEPELHLHPALHQRLVQRIRASSTQSLVTTQSPQVAAAYQPENVLFVKRTSGVLTASKLRSGTLTAQSPNSIRKLYTVQRHQFYEALMGGIVIIPEGTYDYEWLVIWQRIAQACPSSGKQFDTSPLTIVPTNDAAVVDTFKEVAKFRPEAITLLDGDSAGLAYVGTLKQASPTQPRLILRYGEGAAVECLAAWILEPALTNPGPVMSGLLPQQSERALSQLQKAIVENKKNREMREELAWEALDNSDCCARVCEFFHDVAAISAGLNPANIGWEQETDPNFAGKVYIATHIRRS